MNFNFGTPISASSAMIVGYSGPLAGNGFENQPAPQNDMVEYFQNLTRVSPQQAAQHVMSYVRSIDAKADYTDSRLNWLGHVSEQAFMEIRGTVRENKSQAEAQLNDIYTRCQGGFAETKVDIEDAKRMAYERAEILRHEFVQVNTIIVNEMKARNEQMATNLKQIEATVADNATKQISSAVKTLEESVKLTKKLTQIEKENEKERMDLRKKLDTTRANFAEKLSEMQEVNEKLASRLEDVETLFKNMEVTQASMSEEIIFLKDETKRVEAKVDNVQSAVLEVKGKLDTGFSQVMAAMEKLQQPQSLQQQQQQPRMTSNSPTPPAPSAYENDGDADLTVSGEIDWNRQESIFRASSARVGREEGVRVKRDPMFKMRYAGMSTYDFFKNPEHYMHGRKMEWENALRDGWACTGLEARFGMFNREVCAMCEMCFNYGFPVKERAESGSLELQLAEDLKGDIRETMLALIKYDRATLVEEIKKRLNPTNTRFEHSTNLVVVLRSGSIQDLAEIFTVLGIVAERKDVSGLDIPNKKISTGNATYKAVMTSREKAHRLLKRARIHPHHGGIAALTFVKQAYGIDSVEDDDGDFIRISSELSDQKQHF